MIGKRLRESRYSQGMSQSRLEGRAGLTRGYVSKIEKGYKMPTLETLKSLAAALGISFSWLATGEDNDYT